MSVTPSYRRFVLEQPERVATAVRDKAMFGGIGLYSEDLFFALIADDRLYFKVDDTNRPDFEAQSMEPFRPHGPEGEPIQYYALPQDVLEDPELLAPWVAKAMQVARRKKAKKRRPT
jgi:DNA transformation protein